MARPKRKGKSKQISAYINADVFDRFSDYCDKYGMTKTTALERILSQFLNEHRSIDPNGIYPMPVEDNEKPKK